MKTTSQQSDTVRMPAELLAEARLAAKEELRPTDELVSDAVRYYLQHRKRHQAPLRDNLAQLLMNSPFAGADLALERHKENPRPIDL